MEALKANKIIGNQNDFYFFQIPGNEGFKISGATLNSRIFLFSDMRAKFKLHDSWDGLKTKCSIIEKMHCFELESVVG